MSKKEEIKEAIDFVKENLKDLYKQLEEEEKKDGPKDDVEAWQRHLYNHLTNMINWTYYCQGLCKEGFKMVTNPKAYAKEVATIKLCLPRRSGHTTFAKNLFKDFFKKAIYLTTDFEILRGAKELFDPNKTMDPVDLNRMGSIYNVRTGKYKGITPDAVIVDCASFLSKQDIELIYDEFSKVAYVQEHFIFLFLE